MKKISIAAAAALIAMQLAPSASVASADVEALRSIQAAVKAGNQQDVAEIMARFPEVVAANPVLATELNSFITAPKNRGLRAALGFKMERAADAAVENAAVSLY